MGTDKPIAPVFVVSTGRCGSTLLSSMVRLHPDILSLSEFFGHLGPGGVRAVRVGGKAAFRRLNTPLPGLRRFIEQGRISEFLYPAGPDSRYGPAEVPPIMCMTLPHLTDEPESLWDELGPALRARGRHALTDHYRFVFEWLMRRFGRRTWIERTGGTLPMAPVLARHYPDARFVHIYRDGRDTAISMSVHPGFRPMTIRSLVLGKIGLDPFSAVNWGGSSPWVHIPARIQMRLMPPKWLLSREIPLESFGWLWSGMVERGTEFLDTLHPDRTLPMRFETLLESPREEMTRFIEFVAPELANRQWLEDVTALPRPKTPVWPGLDTTQQARLAEACARGQEILGYAPARGGP